ncbi:MAG: hypothetical protein SGI97_01200 [candidate division Zixibacteria bacterium]|nr:hypothetical protein [candidate division Zixibacteria bacterium]
MIIVVGFFVALAGGYVTALTARGSIQQHIFALAGLIVLGSIATIIFDKADQPIWYQLSLLFAGALGALAGGRLRKSAI